MKMGLVEKHRTSKWLSEQPERGLYHCFTVVYKLGLTDIGYIA